MRKAKDMYGTAFRNGSAVLMARIVDRAGVTIRRSDVLVIVYSIYEVDPCWPENWAAVAGHERVPLPVADVIFDTLQLGDPWTLDSVGYNFLHELDASEHPPFPRPSTHYEICYRLFPTNGQETIIRFQVRG